jgi:GTP-binding protein EngB required for normal cell division
MLSEVPMLEYGKAKEDILATIEQLSGCVRDETARSLATVKSKLDEEAFNLVILGQFKRGKSTFINALLGENILPTAIVPLTSVVTILRYGAELKIEVRYHDDRIEVIALPDLPSYITERGNPQNKKSVKEVTVFYPSEYLKGGVRIIDTPGVGSVYRHNTDVAYNYLPYVDAGIFIISADPPLSESELQFLKDIRGFVDKLFFAMNKIDQVSDEDRRESLEFTARILEQVLGVGAVKIYPLSARWALEAKKGANGKQLEQSLLPDFEQRLQEFLIHEKGKVFFKSVLNSLLKLISDETISFKLEQEAIKLPVQELTAKVAQFEEEMKTIAQDREHNHYLLSGHLKKLATLLDAEITTYRKESIPALQREIEEEYRRRERQGDGNLREELEAFLFERIRDLFTVWRHELTEKISSELEEVHGWFAARTNETIERILSLTSDIFDLKLKPFTAVEPLSKKSEFYFMFKDDPVGLELVQLAATSVLPWFISKKIVLNKMLETASELVDRHCGRIRYDLVQRLEKTVRDFQKALNEKIDMTLEGIRISFQKALSLKQEGTVNVDRNLSELSVKLDCISNLRDQLLPLSASIGCN